LTFLWPGMFWFLLAIPLLVALYIWIGRRRKQYALRYANFGLVQTTSGRGPGWRRHLPATLFLIAIVILVVTLARPQMTLRLPSVQGIVILAFDTSGSMAADDVSPSRLEAAKTVAHDFVARQPKTVQIGVVAFSDSGFSIQAPTNDAEAIFTTLNRLTPQRSTSLATAISVSLDMIAKVTGQIPENSTDFSPELIPTPTEAPPGQYSPAVIVLISDGENTTNSNPLLAAQEAARRGVRIHTIGIGSPGGANLNIDGVNIHTQIDEAMLQQISEMTGGVYYNAATEDDLRAIYEKIDPQLVVKRQKTEITSILAGLSSLVLLSGGFLSLLWFNRVL
jgi:Ca-activated chloride channel family protein